jgi:hypothetical protein
LFKPWQLHKVVRLVPRPVGATIKHLLLDYLRTWMPWIHKTYHEVLEATLAEDDRLKRNFTSSVFSAITFNFPPDAVCDLHIDHSNWAPGICAITAGGSYDPKQSGLLILYDLKLVVEFPPGTTMLIPSALFLHGNVGIRSGEKRFVITQYTAGGLFRWLDCGQQTERSLRKRDQSFIKDLSSLRWQDGIALYSTWDKQNVGEPSDPK